MEQREFRLHKDILWSIIKSQAGTLSKAILELVMNSIDAAATRVNIELGRDRVVVEDDGRGFASRAEIEDFFETFGTPHAKGDATYGRFRMGRGQIMAFTRNRWRSGAFSMHVDIRDLGLAYNLVTESAPHAGCRIEGELYEALRPSEYLQVQDSLRELCKYAPIPVHLNGERISVNLSAEKWTFEDEDAYYLLRQAGRYLEVYNLGVHVKNFYPGDYGVSGVVVSKRQLEVNFARNDILVAECQVWKRMAARIRSHARSCEERKPKQNAAYRELVMSRLLSGSFDTAEDMVDAITRAKVWTDYSGKHYTLQEMRQQITKRLDRLVWLDEHSLKADRIHQSALAFVLHPSMPDRCHGMAFGEAIRRIQANLADLIGPKRARGWAHLFEALTQAETPLEAVAQAINDRHDNVPEAKLTKDEVVTLKAIREMSARVAWAMDIKPRAVHVCVSETVDGFTDGASVISVERKFLKVGGYAFDALAHFDRVRALLVHEYLHDANDSTGHEHPPEFYERFHELLSFNEGLSVVVFRAVQGYLWFRRKAGLPMRAGDLKGLDLVGDEAAGAPQPGTARSASASHPGEHLKPAALPVAQKPPSPAVVNAPIRRSSNLTAALF